MERAFTKYIEESNKIHNGPPARYKLKPEVVNLDGDSELRRFTLGKRNTRKVNRTVLLVGATGSGKSTLVNALVNFVMGVKFEDQVWFEIITIENDRPKTETQTIDVSVYEVFGFQGTRVPYSLTIIDTPGYGDIRGTKHDRIVTKKLQDLFSAPGGVDTIDAVGLVLKASESRLDDRMTYVFNSVTSLFGKNMEKNIVAMITFSNGREPTNAIEALETAGIKWAKDKNNKPLCFLFDNCQKEKIKSKKADQKAAENAFKLTEENMLEFSFFLEESQPQSLRTSVAVIKERIRLEACIQNLNERVKTTKEKQAAMNQNRVEFAKFEQMMKENKDFTTQVTETYKQRVKIDDWWDYKAVSCLNCKENCHYPGCTWAWSPSRCEVMKNGNCTSCSGKCPVDDHVKEKWKYVTKTRTVTKTIEEMKANYHWSKVGSEEKTTFLAKTEKEMADLQQTKNHHLNEAFNIIQQLNKIALNAESVHTYIHLEYLIENMTEKGDTEKVQELKGMTTRINEYSKAAAKYFSRMRTTDHGKTSQDQD